MIHEEGTKIMALEEDKRERILNAAMSEFLNGYKKASTDNIVREAGISKGLLFHYFGTKEKLYSFLVEYAVQIVQIEYIDLINVFQKDILDSIWQLSLLKQDLSRRFPTIFEFLTRVYVDDKDCPAKTHIEQFQQIQAKMMKDIYSHIDMSLFRDDIAADKALELIMMMLNGYIQKTEAYVREKGVFSGKSYDDFLDEFKQYLDIIRKCFYK